MTPRQAPVSRRNSLPTIAEEIQFCDMGNVRIRRRPLAVSSNIRKQQRKRAQRRLSLPTESSSSSSSCSDLSNLAPSNSAPIARLAEILGLRLVRNSLEKIVQWTNKYPSLSSVEAIPEIDAQEILDESDYDSSSSSSCSLECADPTEALHDEEFYQAWQQSARVNQSNDVPGPIQHHDDPIYLEIEKGKLERLRGSKEMMQALNVGYVRQVDCLCCPCHMVCIADAAMVLCPNCRSISPIELSAHPSMECYGVGLGMEA